MAYRRYGIFYTPAAGAFAEAGARWLGWDLAAATSMPHPDIANLPRPLGTLTETPRRYGFHATLKPPFRLDQSQSEQGLADATAALAAGLKAVTLDGLRPGKLGGFLALMPVGDGTLLGDLAAVVVADLDRFRAPMTPEELARRSRPHFSPRQTTNLARWGYAHVMEDYRFHMTLTGRLQRSETAAVTQAMEAFFAPALPAPFTVDALSLVGEDALGMFHLLDRYPLVGAG